MKYLFTYLWTFAFIHMTVYVTSAICGTAYDFILGTIISVPCAICVYILAWLIPGSAEEHHISANH